LPFGLVDLNQVQLRWRETILREAVADDRRTSALAPKSASSQHVKGMLLDRVVGEVRAERKTVAFNFHRFIPLMQIKAAEWSATDSRE